MLISLNQKKRLVVIDDGFEVRFLLVSTLGFHSQTIIKSIQDDLRALLHFSSLI